MSWFLLVVGCAHEASSEHIDGVVELHKRYHHIPKGTNPLHTQTRMCTISYVDNATTRFQWNLIYRLMACPGCVAMSQRVDLIYSWLDFFITRRSALFTTLYAAHNVLSSTAAHGVHWGASKDFQKFHRNHFADIRKRLCKVLSQENDWWRNAPMSPKASCAAPKPPP